MFSNVDETVSVPFVFADVLRVIVHVYIVHIHHVSGLNLKTNYNQLDTDLLINPSLINITDGADVVSLIMYMSDLFVYIVDNKYLIN